MLGSGAGTGTVAAPLDVTSGTEEDKPARIFQEIRKRELLSLQDTPRPSQQQIVAPLVLIYTLFILFPCQGGRGSSRQG